jgi:hypothetical protein
MGDRANVYVKDYHPEKGVYLYTHWGGHDLPVIVQDALIRGTDRWSDESYLTRIIFSEMIKDHVLDGIGFGISATITDNEHKIIVVNPKEKTIGFAKPPESINSEPEEIITWSMDEYILMEKEELREEFFGD